MFVAPAPRENDESSSVLGSDSLEEVDKSHVNRLEATPTAAAKLNATEIFTEISHHVPISSAGILYLLTTSSASLNLKNKLSGADGADSTSTTSTRVERFLVAITV